MASARLTGVRSALRVLYPVLAALAAAVVIFPLLYRTDNKYTHAAAQPIGGILFLDEAAMDADPVRYLVREWEYYPDALLTPGDFAKVPSPMPERYMSVGQFGGFEAGNRSPHGCASYRLTILLPGGEKSYSLLIPEVYTAYRLYINGMSAGQMGVPEAEAYRGALGARLVNFSAAGRCELILAVADYDSFYSGITHPPAFGEPQAVLRAWNASLTLRAVACSIAVFSFVLFLYASLRARYRLGIPFALLCLCFAGSCSTPLIRAFLTGAVQPVQALRTLCFYAIFPIVLILLTGLIKLEPRYRRAIRAAAWTFCSIIVLFVGVLPQADESRMRIASVLTDIYKFSMAAALLLGAANAVRRNVRMSTPLLGAVSFFILSLAFDRLLPLYEPILTGWFPEVGGSVLLLMLGGQLGADIAGVVRREAALAEALRQERRMLGMQREHYEMLDRQIGDTRALRHDMRQQMLLISSYAQKGDLPGLRAYLSAYAKEAAFQEPLQYCANHAMNVLLRYYSYMAREAGIDFRAQVHAPDAISLQETDIAVVLGNLLENAVEACRAQPDGEERFIRVSGEADGTRLMLAVDNSFSGEVRASNGRFFTTKKGHTGQGLRSVREAAERNDGLADFSVKGRVFEASVVMKLGS